MVTQRDEDQHVEVRPPVGGFQTKYRSQILLPQQSPDLENVQFDERSIKRRDGAVPLTRFSAPKNAIRNRGYTWLSRDVNGSIDFLWKRVDGYGLIGHRPHFNSYEVGPDFTFTLSMLIRPEPSGDEPTEGTQAEWWNFNSKAFGNDAGQPIEYLERPIISKGQLGTLVSGGDVPFLISIHNVVGVGAVWQCAVFDVGTGPIILQSSATAFTRPQPLHTYRITLHVTTNSSTGGNVTFRIAHLRDDGAAPDVETLTAVMNGSLATNDGPIMLFDASAAVVDNLLPIAPIDYPSSVLRFEGRVQDISMWRIDQSDQGSGHGTDFTFADSFEPLDTTRSYNDLLGHWGPLTVTEADPKEETGGYSSDQWFVPETFNRDVPLVFWPGVPLWNKLNGRGGLYFDGANTYAFMPTATQFPLVANINFRTDFPPAITGAYEYLIRDGQGDAEAPVMRPHGISVTFIPDVTIGDFEKTLVNWPGVFRLTINAAGILEINAGDGSNGFNTAISAATFVLIPGQRYTVNYLRTSNILFNAAINGLQPASWTAAIASVASTSRALTAMLLGCDVETPVESPRSDALDGAVVGDTNGPGLASGRHFHGRIEDVRLIGGNFDVLTEGMRKEILDDEMVPLRHIWKLDDGTLTVQVGDQPLTGQPGPNEDSLIIPIDIVGKVFICKPFTFPLEEKPFHSFVMQRAFVVESITDEHEFKVHAFPQPDSPSVSGVELVHRMEGFFTPYMAWWNFDQDVLLNESEESRYRGDRESNAEAVLENPSRKRIYEERLAVPDKIRMALPLTLRCKTDRTRRIQLTSTASLSTVGLWWQKTPKELKPRIARGLVSANNQDNPITLIRDLKLSTGERFTIVAAASSLYWLQPPWWHGESPFDPQNDPDQISFFGSGQPGNHIEVNHAVNWDVTLSSQHTIEMFVKVSRFGIRRCLALNWATPGAGAANFNWMCVLTEFGALHIEGINTDNSLWRVGTITGPGSGAKHGGLEVDRWHHISFYVDGTQTDMSLDRITIDGLEQPLDTAIGARTSPDFGAGTGLGKYVAGWPLFRNTPNQNSDEIFTEVFFGWMREFRISGEDVYGNGVLPVPPRFLFGVSTTTLPVIETSLTHLKLDEGEGAVVDDVGGTSVGILRCPELLPIFDGELEASNSTARHRFDSTIFNEVLYITNGLGPPLAIRWKGILLNPRGDNDRILTAVRDQVNGFDVTGRAFGPILPYGFQVSRMGVGAPSRDDVNFEFFSGAGAEQEFIPGIYTFAITNVSADNLESNPIIFSFELLPSSIFDKVRLTNLPRPLERHVVERRLYVSGVNTAAPAEYGKFQKLQDITSDQVEIDQSPGAGGNVVFTNDPAPVGPLIEAHRGRVYIARGREVIFSEGGLPESFALSTLTPSILGFDSPGGHEITALVEHNSRLYVGKRDSVFNVVPGQNIFNYTIYRLNTSKGWAARLAMTTWDQHLFGVQEKGVHVFDGARVEYIGEDLEGFWRNIDRSPCGMDAMQGVYFETLNFFMLAVRRKGEGFGRELLVFDKVIRDPQTGRHPWTLFRTIKISFLAVVEDRLTDLPKVLIGTPDGQVYEFFRGQIDGSFQHTNPVGISQDPFGLEGLGAGGIADTLTVVGVTLDTIGDGLRGLWCELVVDGVVLEARIRSNTGTTLTFEDDVPGLLTTVVVVPFVIGGYHAFWTSPWMPLSRISQAKEVHYMDMDFEPQASSVDFRHLSTEDVAGGRATNDVFDFEGVPESNRHSFEMSLGWHSFFQKISARGFYWRYYIGTKGIKKPFNVFGLTFQFSETGKAKGVGRRVL